MKELIQIIFLIIIPFAAFCDVAIIDDKDGYTNVRLEPNSDSKIIYKIQNNEVFFYYDENFPPNENIADWVYVMIPTNSYSIQVDDSGYIYGYIHKSRLKKIETLELITDPSIKLNFEVEKVDTTFKHETRIERSNCSEYRYLVNGFAPYGLEISLNQSYEVKSLDLIVSNQTFKQPQVLVKDLYNLTFESGLYSSTGNRFKTYQKDDVTFIEQKCADGAGTYKIVWVIKNGKIIQRLAGNKY